MDVEDTLNLLSFIEEDVHECLWLRLKSLIHSTYLPELKFGEERPFEESDFVNHRILVKKNIRILEMIFENLDSKVQLKNEFHFDVETVYGVVLLCGEQLNQELWTTKETQESAQTLLNTMLHLLNCKCFTKLLFQFEDGFISTLFLKLRPKLLKDTWKRFPAAVACFKWLLFHIKRPNLSCCFEIVLPTALIILDDHEFRNRITGMQCIEHIVNNVTATEINWYGRGTLMYKSLEPLVYFREPELLPTLISCLIALLKQTESNPSGLNLEWSRFDDVLNIWLPGLEMEQNIASRLVNLECLTHFLVAAGLVSLRWSAKLLNIITEFSADQNTREKSLEILLVFIEVAWPEIQHNCESIIIILTKVAMDVPEPENNSESSSVILLLKMCLNKLKEAAPDQVNVLMSEMSHKEELRSAYCILVS